MEHVNIILNDFHPGIDFTCAMEKVESFMFLGRTRHEKKRDFCLEGL